ncbi:MAG: phosphatase PAP2 family protein [Patescibacteria group bacterium]|nr:phosphatase PAP2 family protein [Patescibacteria group bacterium]
MSFDVSIFNLIGGLSRKWQILDWTGIFFAEYVGYFLVLYFLILLFKQEKIREKIYFFSFVSLSLILSRGIIAEALKFFISRPRPFSALNLQPLIDANGVNASMPSGHAAFYFALATAIFFFNKKAGWRFFAAALLTGIARIFTGVHWPTDILAGAIIGIISALIIKRIIPKV